MIANKKSSQVHKKQPEQSSEVYEMNYESIGSQETSGKVIGHRKTCGYRRSR